MGVKAGSSLQKPLSVMSNPQARTPQTASASGLREFVSISSHIANQHGHPEGPPQPACLFETMLSSKRKPKHLNAIRLNLSS